MAKRTLINVSRIDYLLLVGVLILVIVGLSSVYSASSYKAEKETGSSFYFFMNQLVRVAIGLVIMMIAASVDYRKWLGLSPVFYCIGIFMLVLLFSGLPFVVQVQEAKRWLQVGPVTFQPSDFARYALVMLLARVLVKNRKLLDDFWNGFLKYVMLIGIIVVLVGLEKDLGTAVLIALVAFSMLYFADVKLSYLLAIVLSFTSVAMLYMMTNLYQVKRVSSFLDQVLSRAQIDYQLKQSMISLALGGFGGQGIGNSRQKYEFLPEAHKDFIYSVIGEEAGFVGSVVVLLLFTLIIYRGIKIAQFAPDAYGRLLAGGITACIAIYAYMNAAVALGLVPTTGIPMPFISYGGSSLVSHLAAVGLLINISSQCHPSYANYLSNKTYSSRLQRKAYGKKVVRARS
jgi:cell division protein FtsW